MVDPDAVRKREITDKTVLISIMYAKQRGRGTIHPIREIGRIAKERGIIFHCDGVAGDRQDFRSTSSATVNRPARDVGA